MKKISLVVDFHLNNLIFSSGDSKENRDNCLYPFSLLKKELERVGFDISTVDINKEEESAIAFYFDLTQVPNLTSKLNYLFLFETPVIRPLGWERKHQELFDKIFTWDDTLVDNVKYFKINFTHLFPGFEYWLSNQKLFEKKKMCTLISGSKLVRHPSELYSERVKAIRWFEKNANDSEFEFYGVGWNCPTTSNRYVNFFLRKLRVFDCFFYRYKSYRGSVGNKREVLQWYKFAICYENAKDFSGYITEKIFDCFFSGCVPVYLGAKNILDLIPGSCFVNKDDFSSYEQLYFYMKTMSEDRHREYLFAIQRFLFSDASLHYRAEWFSQTVVEHVVKDA